MRRALGLVLTLLLLIPCAAQAASSGKLSQPVVSRCGRHVVELVGGAVRLDGKALKSRVGEIEIVVAPAWRRDCSAVAWVERQGKERRLLVVPSIGDGAESLVWALPPTLGDERIFWVGRSRVAVGVAMLRPRATATWS
jgi:hypothetical protein